jgi:ribosomal protein L40E
MIVENTCRKCGHHYDGHWHRLPPDVPSWETVPCPKCGSKNVRVTTDESNDYHEESDVGHEDYDGPESCDEEESDE